VKLLLASASPRRRELLGLLGVAFDVAAANLDEALKPGEHAREYVERLAREKAVALRGDGADFILAADTSVVVDDAVLGKPGADPSLGAQMLRALSGRSHQVMTGVAVAFGERVRSLVVTTDVDFRALTDAEVRWYVRSGEGHDKAGGYAIQGRAGAFITAVRGSSTNVIGLPLAETALLLSECGLALPWSAA
jgi:septum formation protein